MAKKKLTIEIEFDEVTEDDYTYVEFSSMRVVPEATTVTDEDREGLAESWAQSDWYSVGFVSRLLDLLDGEATINADSVRSY